MLCKYLQEHILHVLPGLQTSLEEKRAVAKASLEILGDSRTTPKERMRYLTRISKRYGELVKDALEGNYSDAFFKDGDPGTRLRAKTMALTDDYEQSMRAKGHSFDVCQETSQMREKPSNSPEQITQSEALLKVEKLLETYRGPELSFLFNPRLVGELFKVQSQKWPLLTSEYIHDICRAVEDFLGKVVDFVCPPAGDTSYLIFQHIVEDPLQLSVESLESKARELFSPYTKSFLFSTKKRLQTSLKYIEHQELQQEKVDTVTQRKQPSGPEIMGSDHDTRVRLLQYSGAYYDVAIETFIDNVVALGVESCLLSKLETIFTSETVVQMDEDTLNLVGGESEDVQSEREMLKAQLATLDEALKRCRRHTNRHNWNQAKETTHFPQTGSAPSKFDREDGSHEAASTQALEGEDAFSKLHALKQKEILNGEAPSPPPSKATSVFGPTPSILCSPGPSPSVFGGNITSTEAAASTSRPFSCGVSTAPFGSPSGGSVSLFGQNTAPTAAVVPSPKPLFGQNAASTAAASPTPKPLYGQNVGSTPRPAAAADIPFRSSLFGSSAFGGVPEGEFGSSGKTEKSKAGRERDTLFSNSQLLIELPRKPISVLFFSPPPQVRALIENMLDVRDEAIPTRVESSSERFQCLPAYLKGRKDEISFEEARWRDYQLIFDDRTKDFVVTERWVRYPNGQASTPDVLGPSLRCAQYLYHLRCAIGKYEPQLENPVHLFGMVPRTLW